MRFRSSEALFGRHSVTGYPRAAPIMAYAIPVFPLVASMMVLPGTNAPLLRPASIIPKAGRSFTDPPGLNHSALPQISTFSNSRPMLASRSKGVLPMRARMDSPARAAEKCVLPVVDVDAIRFAANILDFGQLIRCRRPGQ